MKSLLIWGAGDQGTVTLDCALAAKAYDRIDFLEIAEKGHRKIPNRIIYQESNVDLYQLFQSYDEVVVAAGDNELREKKSLVLNSMGIPMATVIHPTAFVSPSAAVAKGCTILANAVVHTNASVGMSCIINTAAIVEHDCVLEDFVNISPKAAMSGHTLIGCKAFLGIGSTVIDNIRIGSGAVVGAGAVVIRDVPPNVTVAGVPAGMINKS